MLGQISSGDRVDVYAGFQVYPIDRLGRPISTGTTRPVLRLIMQNVAVLALTKSSNAGIASANSSQVTLRTTANQAEQLAFASDNGKLWLVERPPSGARPSPPNLQTVETVVFGTPPLAALDSFKVAQ